VPARRSRGRAPLQPGPGEWGTGLVQSYRPSVPERHLKSRWSAAGRPRRLATSLTVAAPTPNRAGQVAPQAVQTAIELTPASGSVVPSWSQRSIRSVSVSHSMLIVIPRPSRVASGAGRTTGQAYAMRDLSSMAILSVGASL
jgi:hypothetical protein